MRIKIIFKFAVTFVLLAGQFVYGHTIFIQSTNYWIKQGYSKYLYIGWGHHLPLDDAIQGEKLKFIKVIDPAGGIHEVKPKKGRSLHSYPVEYNTPGTYTLAAATNPGFYTIYIDHDRHIHHFIGPKSEIKDAARIIVSLFTHQSTKAYVVCEKSSNETPEPVGFEWELMPNQNPATIRDGDIVDFSVLYNGKPYEGDGVYWASRNGYSTGFDDYLHSEDEVANGKFSVHFTQPGIWYVSFYTDQEPPADLAGQCNFVRYKSTLVFEVFDLNKPHDRIRSGKIGKNNDKGN
jgi:uncharacterized GH25 family protein